MREFFFTLLFLFVFGLHNARGETFVHGATAYEKTVTLWTKVYKELESQNAVVKGTSYIQPIKGNGYKDRFHDNHSRDTIVFIPNTTSLGKPLDLIFYFHGLGGFKKRDFKKRVLRHTMNFPLEKNYAIVIPEMPWSQHTSTPRKRQGRVFLRESDFPTFWRGVVKVVRAHLSRLEPSGTGLHPLRVAKVFLLGHSAGGSTLMSLSRSSALNWLYELEDTPTLKIIFSDAAYGYWLDITWRHFKVGREDSSTQFVLLTRKWDKPYRHTLRFLRRHKEIPSSIYFKVFERKEKTHGEIGDVSFRWIYTLPLSVEESEEDHGCGEEYNNE